MNFQQKLFGTGQDLRDRAATLGKAALLTARERAGVAAARVEKRVGVLKTSLTTLGVAGRALEKVARRHGAQFVKQNFTLAQAARKDVTSLALDAIDALSSRGAPQTKPRASARKPVARKRAPRARVAKAA